MYKKYINRKIKNCEDLIANATSVAQADAYKKYYDFWLSKLKPKVPLKEAMKAFKLEFPNKKSHYKRDGKTYRTKAFREFLKSFK